MLTINIKNRNLNSKISKSEKKNDKKGIGESLKKKRIE